MSEEKKQKSDEIKEFGALMLNETNIYFHNWLKLKKAMK